MLILFHFIHCNKYYPLSMLRIFFPCALYCKNMCNIVFKTVSTIKFIWIFLLFTSHTCMRKNCFLVCREISQRQYSIKTSLNILPLHYYFFFLIYASLSLFYLYSLCIFIDIVCLFAVRKIISQYK